MSDTSFNVRGESPFPSAGKENQPGPANGKASTKTPSKSRVSLGAPATFYFKYMNSSKKASANNSVLDQSMENVDNLTGTISIPGLNKSVNLAETSIMSIGASSSGSSGQSDGDMLNMSTLSDTTDLTASSFVLQATSRQMMRNLSQSHKTQPVDKKESAQESRQEAALSVEVPAATLSPLELLTLEVDKDFASSVSKASPDGTNLLAEDSPPPPPSASNSARRQSFRGSSPSLRQRVSATPQSLQKLTQDLRNQRINRQESIRRLSGDSKYSIQSLNAQLEALNQDDTTTFDRKRLPPAFWPPRTSLPTDSLDNQSYTTQALGGAVQEIMATQESDATSNVSIAAYETATNRYVHDPEPDIPLQPLPALVDIPKSSPGLDRSKSAMSHSDQVSSVNLAPETDRTPSTPRLTPTKLKSTPRRLPNPKLLDSPARNTRSMIKTKPREAEGDVSMSEPPEPVSTRDVNDHSLSQLENATSSLRHVASLVGNDTLRNELCAPYQGMANAIASETPLQSEVFKSIEPSGHVPDSPLKSPVVESEVGNIGKANIEIDLEVNTATSEDLSGLFASQNAAFLVYAPEEGTESQTATVDEGQSDQTPDLPVENSVGESEIGKMEKNSIEIDWVRNSASQADLYDQTASIAVYALDNGTESQSATVDASNIKENPQTKIFDTDMADPSSVQKTELHPPESTEARCPLSPTQSEGDTASLGDLSSVFHSSQGTTSVHLSPSISVHLHDMPQPPSPSAELSKPVTQFQPSLESAQSTRSPSDGDTATSTDLADILGLQSSPLRLQAGEAPQPDFIAADLGCVSRTQTSTDSREISGIDGEVPETASSHDLAQMLGYAPPSDHTAPTTSADCHEDGATRWGSEEVHQHSPQDLAESTAENTRESLCTFDDEISSSASRKRSRSTFAKCFTSPEKESVSPNTGLRAELRLTPNSHKKITPTKLASSPRRVVNPNSVSSPARNTRSAKRAVLEQREEKELPRQNEPADSNLNFVNAMKDKENNDMFIDFKTNKRRKSSMIGLPKDSTTTQLSLSPVPMKSHPVGILSSRKKVRSVLKSSQRSVAFGSPEAAEYHVGSPSMSMTPMPASRAKALFSIPRNDSSGEVSDGENQTVEIEADLNVLVDKITVENMKNSPALSPIANRLDYSAPVVLPGNYCLYSAPKNDSNSSPFKSSIDEGSSTNSFRSEEQTVELEGGIEGLLHNIGTGTHVQSPVKMAHKLGAGASNRENSPADSSVEMTDALPVVLPGNYSLYSVPKNDSSSFSVKSSVDEGSSIPSFRNEERTVELEGGIEGLLRNMDTAQDKRLMEMPHKQPAGASNREHSPADSSVEMTDAQSIASVNSAKSDKFTSKFALDAQKLNFSPNRSRMHEYESADESMDVDEGHTVELENGMTGLLAAAGVRHSLADLREIASSEKNSPTLLEMPSDRFQKASSPTKSPNEADDSLSLKQSRRSSFAKHRFSLEPDDGIHVSFDGSIKANENSFFSERTVSFQLPITTDTQASKLPKYEPLTLGFDEIMSLTGLDSDALRPPFSLLERDLLVRFDLTASRAIDPAFHRWNHFMRAVCGEVEQRTDNDGTAAEALSSVFEEQPERFVTLQRQLRSEDSGKVTELIQLLLKEGRKAIGTEWDMWLGSVMESFSSPLHEVIRELSDELAATKEISEEYERIHHAIGMVNSTKTQRARRKSLVRRKVRLAKQKRNDDVADV